MSDCRFVWLRCGAVIPLAAVELAIDLERRGVKLLVDGDDILVEGPHITDEDISELRRWKPHVHALLRYVESDEHLVHG